jgi:checkpoint serine/threonine-protein kinase
MISDVFELQPNVRFDQPTLQAQHLGAKPTSQSKGKQRQEPLPDHSQVRHQKFTRLEQGCDKNYDRRTISLEGTATTSTIHRRQQQQEDTHSPQRQTTAPYTVVDVPLRFGYKQSLVDSQVIERTTHNLVRESRYSSGSLRQIKRPPRKAVKKVETTLTLDQESVPLLEHLGDGNYGSVCKVKWKNQLVAMKIHKLPDRWDHYMLQHIAQKSPVAHRYVVRSHALYLDTKASYRIMDYSSQGTLWDFLKSFCQSDAAGVPESLVQLFTLRILQAVAMLHSINVVHMDLKLDNILLDYSLADEATPSTTATVPFKRSVPPPYASDSNYWNKISLKLIDFGLAVNLDLLASPAAPFVLAHARWNTRKTVDMPAIASNANWPIHHLDYWGVANCAHVLLFGSALNMTALKRPKRYWNEPFWTAFFKALVFSPKPTIDDGIQDLKGLIRDLEVSLNTKCVKDDAIYHLGQYDLSRKTKKL